MRIVTLVCIVTLSMLSTCAMSPAFAKGHHHAHKHHHHTNVGLINYKLARYVHPTHTCSNEQLATQYGNGDGFVGKKMANGNRLDRSTPTVAHRHLSFGTRLTLTNPHNGRSVTATVTDRGPYSRATLDLSPATARALGMTSSSYVCVN